MTNLVMQWIEQYYRNEKDAQNVADFLTKQNASIMTNKGLSIARILQQWQCDKQLILSGLLYPFLTETNTSLEQAEKKLDPHLLKLVYGAKKMNMIHARNRDQADELRKMMLAMVDDIRVVVLKLAERLYLINEIHNFSASEQTKIAQETLDYYAPLANRLGMGELKWQLEDSAFQILHPDAYKNVIATLQLHKNAREKLIQASITEMESLLKSHMITSYVISGRAKHAYSIYKKAQRKEVTLDKIFDTSAIRIVVNSLQECYTILSLAHEHWQPIQAEFDDYIAKPKPNGYQSIHTAVLLKNNTPLEIQIRTKAMHQAAEQGIAAHWQYKENKAVHEKEAGKILLLRELLDWQSYLSRAHNQTELYRKAFHDRIYVFSPEGEVFDLPQGATPLDFAYLVHTDIGHRCRGAKINNVLVPLTTSLKTGDHIDILTSKENHPSHDWIRPDLGFLITNNAIRKVKAWYRKQDFEKNLSKGKELWEKIVEQYHFKSTDLQKLLEGFDLKKTDTLLAALGAGDIASSVIIQKLTRQVKSAEEIILATQNAKAAKDASTSLSVHGAKHLLMQLAKCCHPIPGDTIVGYITKNRGISIHQKKCNNIAHIIEDNPERLMDIDWESTQAQSYTSTIVIAAEDREGLLSDITSLLSQLHLSIAFLQSHTNFKNQTAHISLGIYVKDNASLRMVMQKLQQLEGIIEIKRG